MKLRHIWRYLEIFFIWKNAVLQMLKTWLLNKLLLSQSKPRFPTDDKDLTEQPSSIRQCFRLLHAYNINNSLHLYSAFLGTQRAFTQKGGNLLNIHQCAASTWMMQRQPYCTRTPTTHQLIGGEETVMKPISVWG